MNQPPLNPPRKQGGEEFVYAPPSTVRGDQIVLDATEAHHLFKVRRVNSGATVFATTGEGMVYECTTTDDRTLRIVRHLPEFGEPSVHLTLCMAMLKGDANREIVDLATQLGVRSIVFFRSERSEGRVLPDKLTKLRLNAIEAIKQCGRARLPEIVVVNNLTDALSQVLADSAIFVANPATEINKNAHTFDHLENATLIIGPEGGLTPLELAAAEKHRAIHLHLGNRRLRSETAAAAGLVYLLNFSGEIGTQN